MSYWSPEYLMGGWRPAIGDPGFMGWFTVGSYFACAMVALIVLIFNHKGGRKSFFFWGMISFLMILLGINKQLDFQTLLREVGKQIASAQGWMDQRRTVQLWFAAGFGSTALAGFLFLILIMRDLFRRFIVAFIGLFLLLTYVIMRAASFQHLDEMRGFTFVGAEVNWLLELTGIYLILLAGFKEIIHLKDLRKN